MTGAHYGYETIFHNATRVVRQVREYMAVYRYSSKITIPLYAGCRASNEHQKDIPAQHPKRINHRCICEAEM